MALLTEDRVTQFKWINYDFMVHGSILCVDSYNSNGMPLIQLLLGFGSMMVRNKTWSTYLGLVEDYERGFIGQRCLEN